MGQPTLENDSVRETCRTSVIQFFERLGLPLRTWRRSPDYERVAGLVREQFRAMDIGAVHPKRFERVLKTAIALGGIGYAHAPIPVQVHVAIFSTFGLAIDEFEVDPEALEVFPTRLLAGAPQDHPLLDRFVENLQEAYIYFPPYAASAIIANTIQFINSMLLDKHEQEVGIEDKSLAYARYKRVRNGLGDVYGFFVWDKDKFPSAFLHAQVISDADIFLCYVNDICSFYKEEIAGETANFIHDRATAEGTSALEALTATIEEAVQAVENIRRVLKTEKERETWEVFMTNYVAFHYHSSRYRLKELTGSLYVNPDSVLDGDGENQGSSM